MLSSMTYVASLEYLNENPLLKIDLKKKLTLVIFTMLSKQKPSDWFGMINIIDYQEKYIHF